MHVPDRLARRKSRGQEENAKKSQARAFFKDGPMSISAGFLAHETGAVAKLTSMSAQPGFGNGMVRCPKKPGGPESLRLGRVAAANPAALASAISLAKKGIFPWTKEGGMLYFDANVMRPGCLEPSFLPLLFVDCLVKSLGAGLFFPAPGYRRWVRFLREKPATVFFFLFYETGLIL